MRRIVHISLFSCCLRLLAVALCLLFSGGCSVMRGAQKETRSSYLEKEVEKNVFSVPRGDDVVGRLAVVTVHKGDTLPDIARHFSLGISAISAANPGVDLWVPQPGERIVLPLSFILPDAPRRGIVVNVATMRLFKFKGDGKSLSVSTYPIGVGTKERPTPTGQMRVERKATKPTWHVPAAISEDHRKKGDPLPAEVPPGPLNPLGERALYLSKTGYLIHGTNKPASIGLKATNGCLRLYPENVLALYEDTAINTTVVIVDQPYLIGMLDGVLYMEAHPATEASGAVELERMYAKLRAIEKRSGRQLDWKKVSEVQGEARGIPVPILDLTREGQCEGVGTVEVEHPEKLYGMPEIPELRLEGWYVLVAVVHDETEALRLAAIVNHQGPQIPARVLSKRDMHRVIAGPFQDLIEATEAGRRLKVDLEIDGILVEPVTQR